MKKRFYNHTLETVLDYIDETILNGIKTNQDITYDMICRGIIKVCGYGSNEFKSFFKILTVEMPLKRYVIKRKLYFTALEITKTDKRILDIALNVYENEESFSREIKKEFGYSPKEIRDKNIIVRDNRLDLNMYIKDDFTINAMIDDIDFAKERYGFDIDICCAIFDLSQKMEIDFNSLLENCFNTMIEEKSNADYLSPKIRKAIELGFDNEKELNEFCEINGYEYYELNQFIVNSLK